MLCVLLAILACVVLLQFLFLPRSTYFRDAIASADRVELRVFIVGHEEGGRDVAVLNDRADIDALSRSIRIRGIWLPMDELIANSYRIRAIKGTQVTDIVIRGGDRIKRGNWFARIAPSAMETFVRLVEKTGGTMVSVLELVENK